MVTTDYREKTIEANGLKLNYQEWGDAGSPPVVMLHGFGVSGHMFDEFAQRAQGRYRLIALDQRGHGDSEWSEAGDYTRDAFVNDVEAFRAAIGLDRFVLIGHSMGGLNAVSYTVRFPEHVSALVLVDVGPESSKEGVDNIVRFTRGPDELEFEQFVEMAHRFNQRRTMENIRDRMRHRLKQSETGKWTWKFDKRFRQPDSGLRIGGELSNDQTWQLFRDIKVPTLLVRGGESDVLSQDVAERAVREMTRATLRVVPGAGHSVPGDNPDDFTFVVQDFLTALDSPIPQFAGVGEEESLDVLVDRQAAPTKRGKGSVVFIAGGIALVLAAGAVLFAGSKNGKRPKSRGKDERRKGGKQPATLHNELGWAHGRALDLVNELAVAGQGGIRRAKSAAKDVDLDGAREAAQDVLHALGEQGRATPQRVKKAAAKARKSKASRSGLVAIRPSVRTIMLLLPLLNVAGKAVLANSGRASPGRLRGRR